MSTSDGPNEELGNNTTTASQKSWRFWIILASLSIAALVSALEVTVISTALSTIVAELSIGEDYPWVANSYMLANAAVQPVCGQLANLYGRRWPTLSSIALLFLGSGIAGGATNGSMLIAGRALQGVGAGGINMLVELIVCDLVPLRERPRYMSVIFIVFSIGTCLGPFVGGALVQSANWRWVFYMNLPIAGVAFVLLFLFLDVKYKKTTVKEGLGRFDWIGSFLVMTATVSVVFALTYGGAKYSWTSWRVILPLILGLLGLVGFHAWEASPLVADPLLPPRLFGNRTSAIVFVATFAQAFLLVWVLYFLPVYFQAVLGSSATRSGVQLLPTATFLVPFAMAGAQFVERTGKYKLVHVVGGLVTTIGLGLFSLLKADSPMAMWVGLQVFHMFGVGILLPSLLPAIQATLTDKDNASSTAAFAYARSYGAIWGIAIPVAVFNTQFDQHLDWIHDDIIRSRVAGGKAYSLGNKEFMSTLAPNVRIEVVSIFVKSLRVSWIVAAALSAAMYLFTVFEKEFELRTELDNEFGLKDATEKKRVGEVALSVDKDGFNGPL